MDEAGLHRDATTGDAPGSPEAVDSPGSPARTTGSGFVSGGPDPGLLADCVHCGFCLPACPTYDLWGEEMDSPRGRIQLMELVGQGEVALDDTVVGHFDACLGCMACVTACPSGVAYDTLIEQTRAAVEATHVRGWGERVFRRAIFALFPEPRRLRVALALGWAFRRSGLRALASRAGLLRRLPARLATLDALTPDVGWSQLRGQPTAGARPSGATRARVALLTGCVESVLFSDVQAAAVRVLAAEGCEVLVPPRQGCCGALGLHSGEVDHARSKARALLDSLAGCDVDAFVTCTAGCGSALKGYGDLLAGDPAYAAAASAFADRVRDVNEWLDELGPVADRHPIPARVVYQEACHLGHAQGVRSAPRSLLAGIPGLEVVDLGDGQRCCGSAGLYNLFEPEPAAELGRRKASHIAAHAPDLVASANAGCALQIGRFADVPVRHPVELLDAAIRGTQPRLAQDTRSQATPTSEGEPSR